MEILGVYQIHYPNVNVKQIKNLVSHTRYKEISEGVKQQTMDKDSIKKTFGDEFFTDESPIYGALNTNLLILPDNQGKTHSCILTKLK